MNICSIRREIRATGTDTIFSGERLRQFEAEVLCFKDFLHRSSWKKVQNNGPEIRRFLGFLFVHPQETVNTTLFYALDFCEE